MSLPDLSKLIGDEWKRLSENQKTVWLEKSRELKLDYDLKTFKAKKAQTGEDAEAEVLLAKLAGAFEGAVTMSQAAKFAQNKKGCEDSLSPFTSDDEGKPQAATSNAPKVATTTD